tara:strand:- start:1024 stop:1182 length:159 start_codon:yes stop_codon:yes gene_type:complete
MIKYLYKLFVKDKSNEKLFKNIEIYEQKKREKQSKNSSLKRNKSSRQEVKEI